MNKQKYRVEAFIGYDTINSRWLTAEQVPSVFKSMKEWALSIRVFNRNMNEYVYEYDSTME